ncbi:MAG: putative quinol monooxygenase [Pontibacterium sp.]
MSDVPYFHVAEIKATHDDLVAIRTALAALIPPTLKEEGCLAFDIRESDEKEGHFILWEAWTTKEALNRHFEEPHTSAYIAKGWTELVSLTELKSL